MRNLLRKALYLSNGRTVRINGRKIRIPEKLIRHFNVRRDNPMEPELYALLGRIIQPDMVFVDVGANMGVFSLLASEIVGTRGKVIVVEPNPVTFGFLSEIIAANRAYNNLILLQLALSDKLGSIPLQLNQDDSILMERASIVHAETGTNTIDVLTNNLDSLFPHDIKPDILKIDVEGAEIALLRGAENIIRTTKPIVCLEVHGLYFDDPEQHVRSVFAFFHGLGYSCLNIFKGKLEAADSFISDSGVAGNDPVSKRPLNKLGYGNLIFVSGNAHKQLVSEALGSMSWTSRG